MTPSLFYSFGEESVRELVLSKETSLRVLILGGESFPPLSLIRRWRHPENRTRIFNIYGVTELSCWATIRELTATDLSGEVRLFRFFLLSHCG